MTPNPYTVEINWQGPRHISVESAGQEVLCLTIPEAVRLRDQLSAMLAKADLIVHLESTRVAS